MSEMYLLGPDGRTPVRERDLHKWARSVGGQRRVAQDSVGGANVSTVFLGLDHSFGHGLPFLFETMVFGGSLDGEQERYSTWDEAEAGHAAMVKRVVAGGRPADSQEGGK